MVHPNILPPSLVEGTSEAPAPRPPRVEYLATLSRHSAAVNVVRFSPNGGCPPRSHACGVTDARHHPSSTVTGDLIASAGDGTFVVGRHEYREDGAEEACCRWDDHCVGPYDEPACE